ncbi:MAG TPA: protein YgfX [Burkholderiales bacterium]|nr:protein YgfX [Burkholderiales bacterium]
MQLKPSRQLVVLLSLAHVLAGLAAGTLPLAPGVGLLLIGLIAGSLIHALRLHALRSAARACVALRVPADAAAAELTLRSGAIVRGRILGDSVVSPLLTVVNIRREDTARRVSLVLLPDGAPSDALRALRVWLRFKVDCD